MCRCSAISTPRPPGDKERCHANKLAITGFCWADASCGCMRHTIPNSRRRSPGMAAHRRQGRAASAAADGICGITQGTGARPVRRADQGIPEEVVEMFQDDLKAAKSKSAIVVYPEAPHGFHADYRPSYRKDPAEDAGRSCRTGSRSTAWCDAGDGCACGHATRARYHPLAAISASQPARRSVTTMRPAPRGYPASMAGSRTQGR